MLGNMVFTNIFVYLYKNFKQKSKMPNGVAQIHSMKLAKLHFGSIK